MKPGGSGTMMPAAKIHIRWFRLRSLSTKAHLNLVGYGRMFVCKYDTMCVVVGWGGLP